MSVLKYIRQGSGYTCRIFDDPPSEPSLAISISGVVKYLQLSEFSDDFISFLKIRSNGLNYNLVSNNDYSDLDSISLPSTLNLSFIQYGNGIYVLTLATSTNSYYTSTDGINWTSRTFPESNYLYPLKFANGIFVLTLRLSTKVYTSTDGINWTLRTGAVSTATWTLLEYLNGYFVNVPYSGDKLQISNDGISWSAKTLPLLSGGSAANTRWYSIAYINGYYILTGMDTRSPNTGFIYRTADFITYTPITLVGSMVSLSFFVVSGNGMCFAANYNSNSGFLTTDGVSWDEVALPYYLLGLISTVGFGNGGVYGNGVFMLYFSGGDTGKQIAITTNFIDYTIFAITSSQINYIHFTNNKFFITKESGDTFFTLSST